MSINYTIVGINTDGSFCTMLPPFGAGSVQAGASHASSNCFEQYNATTNNYTDSHLGGLLGPDHFILSANYAEDLTKGYRQITGCMDGSAWNLNPEDVGGMFDSVAYPYTCLNAKKFVSFLAPNTNTYCIRCCNGTNANADCDTTNSMQGCSKAIPGVYTMKDGSTCKLPVIPTRDSPTPTNTLYSFPTSESSYVLSPHSGLVIVGIVVGLLSIVLVIVSVYNHRRGVNRKRIPVISPRLRSAHDGDIEMMPQQQATQLPLQPLHLNQHPQPQIQYSPNDDDDQLPEYRP
ncbi:hypothetical protein BGX26_002962 [Mortierella sp. AD094]|nr:hypothetical protein BGX26_002962 [Mortierella sp. AD094]